MDRSVRSRAGMPDVRDGPDGAAPRRAVALGRPPAEQRATPLDHRHLRLHGRGLPRDDGHARRSHRTPQALVHRRRRLRRAVAACRVRRQRRDAHPESGPSRDRRSDPRTVDPVIDLHDVPGSRPALSCDRCLDLGLLGRQRDRPGPRWRPPRALLVGLGVPAGPARDGAPADPRPGHASRVQGSERRPARPAERRASPC